MEEERGGPRDRAVGDKVKERPTEFLECTGGFVHRGGCLYYYGVCVCVKCERWLQAVPSSTSRVVTVVPQTFHMRLYDFQLNALHGAPRRNNLHVRCDH